MWETWEIDKKGGQKKEASESEGGERNRHFPVLFAFCARLNLSDMDKIYLWWLSMGQEWKQRSSFAMGKFLPENVTNLGKMNHSHFIWTSALTPTPLLRTFIHLWQFYYNLCRCCRTGSQKGMLHGDDPKSRGLVEFKCIFFLAPYDHGPNLGHSSYWT